MSEDSEEKQAFDRVYGEIISGVIASNPGGAIGKPPNHFTDLAATIALAAVKSRAAALEQLQKTGVSPVLTQGVTVGGGGYAGPAVGGALAAPTGTAFTPATPLGMSVAAPPTGVGQPITAGAPGAPGMPGGANATPADRTARLGISQEICPVCKGPRNQASQTQDAQCPIFHFQPHGNLLAAPAAAAASSGPIQPIVTGPTAPISTG